MDNAGKTIMDVDSIRSWFSRDLVQQVNRDRVMELYFTFHPRTAFLKTLPVGAVVADIGAGDGSLSVFRGWPTPTRNDLKLHAYSMEKGRLFDDFETFELGDWNTARPEFGGIAFDAIVCAHFIEHIDDPHTFVDWAANKVSPGGRVYLEWPSPNSQLLPGRAELEAAGVPLVISKFEDDHTHRQQPPDGDGVADAMRAAGFSIEAKGTVRLPWLEDEMLAHFRDAEDGFPRQAAFWSRTGWSQYIIAERCK